jgi:hypothetical protein
VGGTPTVVRLQLEVFSTLRGIEGFDAGPWMGNTLFVLGARDSFQVVAVDAAGTPTVLHDTYGANESHYQALDCSGGSCFVLNRDDGKIYAVEEDMKRGLLLAHKELSDGTTPFNFLLVDEKITPPHDYYPTIYKSSRLMNLDTGTYGDEIAYNNAGTIEVYDMQPGGCLIDDGDASGCEPTFASAEQIVIGGGSMDHNVKFYETQGEKTIVVTGGTGFIGVFKNGPIVGTYQRKVHENLLGRFCHAMDARVGNGEDVIYTGCDTEGESGGALNRWRLDCSGEPCELVKEWSAYPGSAPTAIRWIPGEAIGCPGDRLVFADFAGSLYVLAGDGAAGPGSLLVKSASLEGGGPGAVSGLHHRRTINGGLVDDVLRFSTPAQRYAVTLTTDCGE